MAPPEVYVGTSGFAYKEWRGSFYPEDLPEKKFLTYYAEQLGAVEINNTFYRMPKPELLTGWRDKARPGFQFVLKASQRITHHRRLADVGDTLTFFLDTAAVLGDQLGAVLFQLPPNFQIDLARLRAFLALLPRTLRAAFEFRHGSWLVPETYAALREAGQALCVAEDPEGAVQNAVFETTATWGYLRLRNTAYSDDEVARWAERVRAAPWERAYVFFKHEDEGTGPRLARRFIETYRTP
jgi:uncharacterized protein YecE (DUF72 family)